MNVSACLCQLTKEVFPFKNHKLIAAIICLTKTEEGKTG